MSSLILAFFYNHLRRHYLFVLPGKALAIAVHLAVPYSNIYSAKTLSSSCDHCPFFILALSTFYHLNLQSLLVLLGMYLQILNQSFSPYFFTNMVSAKSSSSVQLFLYVLSYWYVTFSNFYLLIFSFCFSYSFCFVLLA